MKQRAKDHPDSRKPTTAKVPARGDADYPSNYDGTIDWRVRLPNDRLVSSTAITWAQFKEATA